LPVFGPISLGDSRPRGYLPFITEWDKTEIVAPGKTLERYSLAEAKKFAARRKRYPKDGCINEHADWEGKPGLMFFHSRLRLNEPMKLEVLMGYDGPFRLWLNRKSFFTDIKGTNPCFANKSAKTVTLKAGTHDVTVGMDLNLGNAWGFFLRFARRDVTKKQVETGEFGKPEYLV
jgi:sialate O-acetylesterase